VAKPARYLGRWRGGGGELDAVRVVERGRERDREEVGVWLTGVSDSAVE
jgi:hypothetical protein